MVCGRQAHSQSKQSACSMRYKPHSNIRPKEGCLSTIVEIGTRRRETCNARRCGQAQALATKPARPDPVFLDLCPIVIRRVVSPAEDSEGRPKPPRSHPEATPRPSGSQPVATPEPPLG